MCWLEVVFEVVDVPEVVLEVVLWAVDVSEDMVVSPTGFEVVLKVVQEVMDVSKVVLEAAVHNHNL